MLRLGVVGCGVMGEHHVRVLSHCGHKLAGIADRDLERARDLAARYDTPFYPSHEDLIGKVDAVSIAVPTSKHAEVALALLREGIHCLVEKPIAPTLEEARLIIRQAQQKSAKLMVGHVERFNPVVGKLKEIIGEGILGRLAMITTRRAGPFPPRIRDVGVILDLATHDIDVVRYLLGREPVGVFGWEGKCNHVSQDYATVFLDFGNPVASIEVNWLTPHKVRTLTATGSEGIAYLNYIDQTVVVYGSMGEIKPSIQRDEPLRRELMHFVSCVENDEEPLVSGEDAVRVLEIALQAANHARVHRR